MTAITITFRVNVVARDYLKDRAKRNDRSMNKEFSAILRELQVKEKASGSGLATFPDASTSE